MMSSHEDEHHLPVPTSLGADDYTRVYLFNIEDRSLLKKLDNTIVEIYDVPDESWEICFVNRYPVA